VSKAQDAKPEDAVTWLNQGERGAIFGIRIAFFLATAFGRWPMRQFLRIVAFWYAIFDATARRASSTWLTRVYGRPARFSEVYQHILRFARVALDRVFLVRGRTGSIVVNRTGTHHLKALIDEGRGAILVGAHLGSFEAMRAAATTHYPINIVGHFENARVINGLLEQLNPEKAAKVVHVGKDPVGFALKVRELLDNGEMVAILADRVGLNDKQVEVDFMGAPAAFPTGPFLLAATLKAPVYLVFGLYYEPNRYELHCEPFADPIVLPRGNRQGALKDVVQRYAQRVEEYARRAPDNWFNFYDFWKSSGP